eukprot:5690900-Prymnesium_polylepis.1
MSVTYGVATSGDCRMTAPVPAAKQVELISPGLDSSWALRSSASLVLAFSSSSSTVSSSTCDHGVRDGVRDEPLRRASYLALTLPCTPAPLRPLPSSATPRESHRRSAS